MGKDQEPQEIISEEFKQPQDEFSGVPGEGLLRAISTGSKDQVAAYVRQRRRRVFFDEQGKQIDGEEKLLRAIFGAYDPDRTDEIPREPKELIPMEDEAFHQLLKEQVEDVLDSLTPRERRVLQLRFGLENGRS